MNEFILVFRREAVSKDPAPSPEQMQAMMKPWQDWIGSLAAQNKLVSSGNQLASDARVVRPGKIVTDGPYAEIKESIGGYIIIRAESIDEAAELSKDCPILLMNGSVEVRCLIHME